MPAAGRRQAASLRFRRQPVRIRPTLHSIESLFLPVRLGSRALRDEIGLMGFELARAGLKAGYWAL